VTRHRWYAATAVAALIAAGLAGVSPTSAAAAAPGAELIYGLTGDDGLVSFRADAPGMLLSSASITGIGGANVLAIDQRPDTGQLLALTRTGAQATVYAVDPDSGAATRLVDVDRPLSQDRITIDVDPVTDRLRVIADGSGNFSIDLRSGATRIDPDLAYATGDPGAGQRPNVTAIAPAAAAASSRSRRSGSSTPAAPPTRPPPC